MSMRGQHKTNLGFCSDTISIWPTDLRVDCNSTLTTTKLLPETSSIGWQFRVANLTSMSDYDMPTPFRLVFSLVLEHFALDMTSHCHSLSLTRSRYEVAFLHRVQLISVINRPRYYRFSKYLLRSFSIFARAVQ